MVREQARGPVSLPSELIDLLWAMSRHNASVVPIGRLYAGIALAHDRVTADKKGRAGADVGNMTTHS